MKNEATEWGRMLESFENEKTANKYYALNTFGKDR